MSACLCLCVCVCVSLCVCVCVCVLRGVLCCVVHIHIETGKGERETDG